MLENAGRLSLHLLSVVEALLLLALIGRAWLARRQARSRKVLARHRWLAILASRPNLGVLTVTLLPLFVRAALIPVLGLPLPRFHDEFSYLLAADTFASGRLTNPTHPLWRFFESFHIIHVPTYMSMYPPGEGLLLAASQWLTGNPWWGQWMTTGLMCGAICWMLQGWVPRKWAIYGGLLAVLRLGVLSYWMNTYFAGSLPALGGALVFGAWPRLRRTAELRHAAIMGLGFVILANSRPYEGLVFSLPIAVAFLMWLFGSADHIPIKKWLRVALPIAAMLVAAGAAMSYYNSRVTGNPWRMPYQVNRETYAQAPYFWMSSPRPAPAYDNAVMQQFYEQRELSDFCEEQTAAGFLKHLWRKIDDLWLFYVSSALTLPFLALLLSVTSLLRSRRMRFPLIVAGVMVLAILPQTWTLPHYLAPVTGLFLLFAVQGVRYLSLWRREADRLGGALAAAIPFVLVAMILLRVGAAAMHVPLESAWPRGNLERGAIMDQLSKAGGRHLILVAYAPTHDVNQEWVYNRADIDSSSVVWARDMGEEENRKLLAYFRDRRVWLLHPDQQPVGLVSVTP